MQIGNRYFDTENHTYLMAIINVTPDSFYPGSRLGKSDLLLDRVRQMVRDGADLIDLGAESTRPGHVKISDQEEMDRLLPALEVIKNNIDIPVSVDTYKAAVAKEAVKYGCDMINSIHGMLEPDLASVIASSGKVCCLMHNRDKADYDDFPVDFMQDMRTIYREALRAGISKDHLILDPGIGFAKNQEQNLAVLRHLNEWRIPEVPWLLGTSRKSVIGNALGLPVQERLEGTLVTTVLAIQAGYSFVRVHDVKENRRCIDMMEAIRGNRNH